MGGVLRENLGAGIKNCITNKLDWFVDA